MDDAIESTSMDSLPQHLLRRIDEVCDRFEDDIKRLQKSPLELFWNQNKEFIESIPATAQKHLYWQLLALAHDYSEKWGTPLPRDELLARFPLYAHITNSVLQKQIRYFGEFEVLSEIGRGNFGIVYKAIQSTLKRVVALKVLASHRFSRDQIDRFRWEAEAVAALNHPSIVPIYEIGTHENQHFFAMGYVEGSSLRHLIKKGRFPTMDSVRIIRDCATALQFAHDRNIVHRDISPGNIILGTDHRPVIVDFGLAMHLQSRSGQPNSAELIGTPNCMAPEQASEGRTDVGPRSDIYGLGSVLYLLLTGTSTFVGNAESVISQLKDPAMTPVPPVDVVNQIPQDVSAICMKCLEKDPARRYQSMRELADDLNRWLTFRPVLSRRCSLARRTQLFCRRHPIISCLTALCFVLFLGALQYRGQILETESRLKNILPAAIAASPVLLQAIDSELEDDAEDLIQSNSTVSLEGSFSNPRLTKLELLRDETQRILNDPLIRNEVAKCQDDLSNHPDAEVRFRAGQIFGSLAKEDTDMTDAIERLVNDRDSRVQMAGLTAACCVPTLSGETWQIVGQLVADESLISVAYYARRPLLFKLIAIHARSSSFARNLVVSQLAKQSLEVGGPKAHGPLSMIPLMLLRGLISCKELSRDEYLAIFRMAGHSDERIGNLASEAVAIAPPMLLQEFQQQIISDLNDSSDEHIQETLYRAKRIRQTAPDATKKVVELSRSRLTARSPEVRQVAYNAWLATVLPNSNDCETVIRGIHDQKESVVLEVLTTIGLIAQESQMDWLNYPAIRSAIDELAESKSPSVILAAKFAKSHCTPEDLDDCWKNLEVSAKNNWNHLVRRHAYFFIGLIGVSDEKARELLTDRMTHDSNSVLRGICAIHLAKRSKGAQAQVRENILEAEKRDSKIPQSASLFKQALNIIEAKPIPNR